MKKLLTLVFICCSVSSFALDTNHFTITRISAPYFVVDGNSPASINQAYVGFEVKNNNNSGVTYTGLRFTITSVGTSVAGQNYSLLSPASGVVNIGTLAPGETRVCYYYVSYPAHTTAQATFNILLSDNTAGTKGQAFVVYNRSSISANAGGTATQTFTNQDLVGGLVYDDVVYAVGNVKNGDENDFQVAVSPQFDPAKITLLSVQVTASSVPGINVGSTDSLYFISGTGSSGATVTVRWTFRISAFNFTTYLLPCAGATSGSTNYKYALNTSLGSGSPVTVSSSANPLTISKTSDKTLYGVNSPAVFTVTISNPGAYNVTIDRITDELPAGFTFQSFNAASQVSASNSTVVPSTGATGTISFEGGVTAGPVTSYVVPAGGSLMIKYSALSGPSSASGLVTNARDYVGSTEVGTAQNTVSVSATLPVSLLYFNGAWAGDVVKLNWRAAGDINTSRFETERSSGMGYEAIGAAAGVITGSGFADYEFTDQHPLPGINNYRLKIVSNDNRITYSAVLALNRKLQGVTLGNVFPVPFSNTITIGLNTDNRK